ncbi:MAG: hypothetical protein KDF59_12395 [Nitrosomonas sp.]|nr:hypothetical protein [Nitrosomonas sp.]
MSIKIGLERKILTWATQINRDFSTREAFENNKDALEIKQISDALRNAYKYGRVSRKKLNGLTYIYRATDTALNDFDDLPEDIIGDDDNDHDQAPASQPKPAPVTDTTRPQLPHDKQIKITQENDNITIATGAITININHNIPNRHEIIITP